MKPIVQPQCDSCGDTAKFESAEAGQYCYDCLKASASFLSKRDLLESNPLCEIFFAGVWRTTDSTFEVWHQSRYSDDAMTNVWISFVNRNL